MAWQERSSNARLLWFAAIIAPGNIAIAARMLRELFRLPASAPLDALFTRRNPGALLLPALLASGGVAVHLLA